MAANTNSAPAAANPVANQNSASSQDGDRLPASIALARSRVDEAAKWDGIASTTSKVLLVLYVLITMGVAWSTVWSNKRAGALRAAEVDLNNLEREKIRVDAARELILETDAVRNEGKENVDRAKAELVKEQSKLAEEQRKTAEAQREAADAQRALAEKTGEIEKRIAWRKVLPEQRARLIELLMPMGRPDPAPGPGGTTVSVKYIAGNEESRQFALQLIEVFKEARWHVMGRIGMSEISGPVFSGLGFAENRWGRRNFNAYQSVVRAFAEVGLSVTFQTDTNEPGGSVIVLVGSRP